MEPPPFQSSEIDSSPSPIPPTVTPIPMAALSSPPDDDQQLEQQQNPSSPPADSDPLLIPQPQTLDSKDPDPPNPEPENPDHDLQQPEPEDPDDQEGMVLSPSRHPLNVEEEREISPPLSSSRRAPSRRGGKRGLAKNNRLKLAREKKFQALAKKLKPIPFISGKALDFSRHEENLKRLGLWDFAHLEFDRKVRDDLLAKLIVNYNEKNRCSYVGDVRIKVSAIDLARALNLTSKKPGDCGEEDWPRDFVSFVDDFVSNWMLLHEDTWMLPSEVMNWTGMIKEGHPEKVDWAKLIWFMVKRELSKGAQLEHCYYASHLQHLIKRQKEGLLKEKSPDDVEEIMVLKDDDEDEGDVKMAECDEVSHGGEPQMNLENAQPSVEGIGNVESDAKMAENVDSENVVTLGNGDGTSDSGGLVENQEITGDKVENPKITGDQVENTMITVDQVENPKITVDQVENQKTDGDHVESLKTTVDHVENMETAGDHVENMKIDTDHVENMQTAGDVVDNRNIDGDNVENMKIDEDNVEDAKGTGNVMVGIKTEGDDVVIADDAEIQETEGNDLIDFGDCKVDEWDLSRKDGEQEHFLQQCTMSEAKVDEEQTRQQVEEVEEVEAEDDEQVQGFVTLQKCNSFNGLSSGHLMQAMDSSQIPYAAPDFDNHVMLGGPSSLFGNASKRELDIDPEIPGHSLNDGHKRMRTEGPSWDQKPPDLDFCFDQMQQLLEKSRLAHMSSQQTMMNQQQLLFNELGAKDHMIQQLNHNIEELKRRRQAEMARYENELYAMTSVINGYRKALKSTQQMFAEYRKHSNLPVEPLYKDAGEGGVVKTVVELEKERLKREEKERVARIIVEKFEKDWEMKFEAHVEQVDKYQARVSDIQKGVELLKESMRKRTLLKRLVEF